MLPMQMVLSICMLYDDVYKIIIDLVGSVNDSLVELIETFDPNKQASFEFVREKIERAKKKIIKYLEEI